jgi:hypothetical protein
MPPIKKPKALPTLCRWHIYGCEYHYTTDKAHEDICLRRPIDAGADILWRELVTHVESDANPIIDIRASLGPWARELKHVRVLSPGKTPIQDIPYYLDVSSWWLRGVPKPETLDRGLLPSLKRQLGPAQYQLLIAQMDPASHHSAGATVRVLNHSSPRNLLKTMGLQLPAWVQLPIDQCLWNVTPKNAFTDLHTDRGLDTVTLPVGGRKIWVLYEPDPAPTATNKVLQRDSTFYQQWADHIDGAARASEDQSKTFLEIAGPRLRRPYIAVTEGKQGLFVPAGWKHAVFTLETGYLAGWSFGTNEHLKQQIQTILGEMQAAVVYSKPEQYGQKTDYLSPDLWNKLNESLAYVLNKMAEIRKSHHISSVELWLRMIDLLDRLPALKAKNGPAIKNYTKLMGEKRI